MALNSSTFLDKDHPAALLCSGGIDSILIAYRYREHIKALIFFDYGQPAVRQEASAVSFFSQELGIEMVTIKLALEATALTGSDACIVPERNLIFIAHGLHYAQVHGLTRVYYGAIRDDAEDYVDCRIEWVRKIRMARHSTTLYQVLNGIKTKVMTELEAPVITMSKVDVLIESIELGIPIDKTWSCYNPQANLPCSHCASCSLFMRAIEIASKKPLYRDCP